MDKTTLMWVIFISTVLILLAVDLGIFNKKDHVIGVKESLFLSAFYICMGFSFGGFVWYELGAQSAQEYLTGFLVEKSLSLDNIFIISLIFSGLSIPQRYQHRILFFGILGVLILRGIMIALGAKLIHEFEWLLYVFSAFIILIGIKMFFVPEKKMDIQKNHALKWIKKHFPITHEIHGQKFFIRKKDPKTSKVKSFMTPLFIALLFVEFTDVIFAIDSVPAIFTITQNSYIVYTSNIFAILGLRALYFALVAIIDRFEYLKYSLGCVLIFIGAKIFLADLFGFEKFPSSLSLAITFGLIGIGITYSLYKSKKNPAA